MAERTDRLVEQQDAANNFSLVTGRRPHARQRRRDGFLRIEGEERFDILQKFLNG
jgi:hypothetical protein